MKRTTYIFLGVYLLGMIMTIAEIIYFGSILQNLQ